MKLKHVVRGVSALCLLSPCAGAQATASASASAKAPEPPPVAASAPAAPAEPPPPAAEPPKAEPAASTAAPGGKLPYMQRYKPKPMTWEVGLFAGVFLPSSNIALYSPSLPYQPYNGVAFDIGGRLAFFPLAFLGVEAEFMMAHGKVQSDLSNLDPSLNSEHAVFNSYRGQIVGQLPFWSIVPFILVGANAIGATSQPLGHGNSAAFHFGAGVKIPVTELFSLRVDFRENVLGRVAATPGASFSEEVLLGGTFTFGRKAPAAPAEAPDADGDNVADSVDACPDRAALTENGCPSDTDQDGVVDPDDHCPYDAGPTAEGCPDVDVDKDGVPVPCDMCPDDPGVSPGGCPILDTDGDGLIDQVDKCPKEAETRNGFEDADGCPDEIPKEVEKFTGAIKGITFVQGSPKIQKGSDATLKAAADVLMKYPSLKIEITGHTSSEGNRAYNQKLSEDRAEAVRTWLLEHGVPEDRINARGLGPDVPVADNATAAGRATNRRIEFTIQTQ